MLDCPARDSVTRRAVKRAYDMLPSTSAPRLQPSNHASGARNSEASASALYFGRVSGVRIGRGEAREACGAREGACGESCACLCVGTVSRLFSRAPFRIVFHQNPAGACVSGAGRCCARRTFCLTE